MRIIYEESSNEKPFYWRSLERTQVKWQFFTAANGSINTEATFFDESKVNAQFTLAWKQVHCNLWKKNEISQIKQLNRKRALKTPLRPQITLSVNDQWPFAFVFFAKIIDKSTTHSSKSSIKFSLFCCCICLPHTLRPCCYTLYVFC